MLTLYTSGVVKDVAGARRYVAVDGGMSDNIRPALYQARYTFLSALRPDVAARPSVDDRREALRDGRHPRARRACSRTSSPARSSRARPRAPTAYAMASNYNKQPRPAVVAVFGGETHVLARRETYEDLVRLDWATAELSRGTGSGFTLGPWRKVRKLHRHRPARLRDRRLRRGAAPAARGGDGRARRRHAGRDPARGRPEPRQEAGRRPRPVDLHPRRRARSSATRRRRPRRRVHRRDRAGAHARSSQAIEAGKPVVTANKELLSTLGAELFKAADDKGVDLYFEAAVAGGIPLMRPLKESLAGESIKRVIGIVNGTTNFILTRMTEGGMSFSEALAEAERLGYAEEDPTADIEGFDAAAKAAIIASVAFRSRVVAGDVYREGISHVTHRDIEFAQRLGYTVKLLAIAEEIDGDDRRPCASGDAAERPSARVRPRLVQRGVRRRRDRRGPDVLRTRRGQRPDRARPSSATSSRPRGTSSTADAGSGARATSTSACCRSTRWRRSTTSCCRSQDLPGVLAQVATTFGDHDVSIRSVWQEGYGDQAQLVMVTHRGKEANLQATVDELGKLEVVTKVVVRAARRRRRGVGRMPLWRGVIEEYRDRLPVTDATPVVTLQEGGTPLVRAEALSARTGLDVYLKYEGANPTGSFKDRGMCVAISKALEEGARAVCCASTGNTSASAAAYAARAGLRCIVLVPHGGITLGKLAQALVHGAEVLEIETNFDGALEVARELARRLSGRARELGEPVPHRGTEDVRVRDRRQPRTRARLPRHAGRQRRQHHRAMEGLRRVRTGSSGDVRHPGRRRGAVRPRGAREGSVDARVGDPHREPGVVGRRGEGDDRVGRRVPRRVRRRHPRGVPRARRGGRAVL